MFKRSHSSLSANTSAMHEFLHKDNEFVWTKRAEQQWQALKTTLTTGPVLTFFDPIKSIKISTGASKDGLGAALLQAEDSHWKPVA